MRVRWGQQQGTDGQGNSKSRIVLILVWCADTDGDKEDDGDAVDDEDDGNDGDVSWSGVHFSSPTK